MLKSTFKNIAIFFSSLVVVLTIGESATAQLRVNQRDSIPKGQESQYLEYQRQNNQNLRQMRVMPDCSLGDGLGCNKTGTVVEQIINQSHGANYYDLLMRATGGQDNYRNFAAFYNNNPRLPTIPYASFWRNEDPSILDGHRYVLGQSVSRNPVTGLADVTRNFAWSPLSRGREISPRDGLLDLKYSYGRVLLEEVAKIPNLEQQVTSLDLPPDMTEFYLSNISQGLRALNIGDERGLRQSVLRLLSFPYSPGVRDDGWYGRKIVDVPLTDQPELPTLPGTAIVSENPLPVGEEMTVALDVPFLNEVVLPSGGNYGWLYGLIPLMALFLLLEGDSSSSQPPTPVEAIPDTLPPLIAVDNGGESPTSNTFVPPQVREVPEPSALKALLLLTIVLGTLNYKQRLGARG
ncbi:hypothetical protein [Anabaena sp. CCY 9614]|uniref:hypothetical protein n=1 Tax=Anabaena sp. CCY 9614 TaxID=3103869 RepID=UPI0039C5ADDA